MSEKEKQHYVPKFYLKRFSYENNKNQIGVFNTQNNLFIPRAKLKTQAYKPFFYGKDKQIENLLGLVEGDSANLLNDICNKYYIPKMGSKDHTILLMHIVTSLLRTPTMLKSLNDTFSSLSEILDNNAKKWGAIPENTEFKKGETIKLALSFINSGVNRIKDLKIKLIINKTKNTYITSDNPVVKYNYFMEKRKWPGSGNGFSNLGLKIFLPISPQVMLILFDSWVYKVGDNKQDIIETWSELDINNFNLLPFINCDNIIYFNENINEDYLIKLKNQSQKYEKANMAFVKEYPDKDIFGKIKSNSSILVTGTTDCLINLNLSFLKLSTNAKQYTFNNSIVKLRKGHEGKQNFDLY